MKQFKNIFLMLSGAIIFLSCNKQISEKRVDPNNPLSVPPYLILGTILTDMSGTNGTGNLGSINSWDNVHRWNQYHCSNYGYYHSNDYSWTDGTSLFASYLILKNVVQMENEALARSAPAVNPYEAIGKFIRAYYYYNMTSLLGDIPVTDALEASSNPTPSYTPQKQVFQYLLNILDTANSDFASLIASNDVTFASSPAAQAQDIYYGGNLEQWQKAVNSFKLRVLLSLSLQSADPDLNIAQQFATIYNNPTTYPIFQSQTDDLEFTYVSATYSTYYFNPYQYGQVGLFYNMAYTYENAVSTMNDPRVFRVSEPAWRLVDSLGYSPTDYRAFAGASTGEDQGTMLTNAGAGLYSFINRYRYFTTYVGEPDVLVGYKELCFNIAEAMNRGWITGNAETWYKTGINESMNFYGISQGSNRAYFVRSGAVTDTVGYPFNFDFATFYAQPAVQYAGNNVTGLNQIILQKYIAMFENSGWEGYYNWRRTGIPVFQTGTGIGNNSIVPLRWSYPISEQTVNTASWKAALANQQFSGDDLNETMWLLK